MKKSPFFTQFLKDQISEIENEEVKGGAITDISLDNVTSVLVDSVTKPWLDNVTKPWLDNVTLKYPSDDDEIFTDKYPSDNDETVQI